MKSLWFPAIVALVVTCLCPLAPASTPVVSQVHVLSVHVQDHATFDAVFLFFRDTLKLPRVYGELSKPAQEGQRLYAGFSVGNAYFEPCGPYQSDAPFSPDRTARFHGLTFSPATPLAEAANELGRRSIAHSEVMDGGGNLPRFVYLSDALLTGPKQAVSLWEIQNRSDTTNLNFLAASLQEARGGALGVQRLAEVRLGYPHKDNLAQWDNFLTPAKHEGDRWSVGNGPVLRLVPSTDTQIESIVLKVESLERAKTVLSQGHLLGEQTSDHLELDPAKICGLRITLREK
jgi:hypothetical protein